MLIIERKNRCFSVRQIELLDNAANETVRLSLAALSGHPVYVRTERERQMYSMPAVLTRALTDPPACTFNDRVDKSRGTRRRRERGAPDLD